MTGQLIMTTAQREKILAALADPHGFRAEARGVLQSLPMVTDTPKAYILQNSEDSHKKLSWVENVDCESIPLFTSPQALTPSEPLEELLGQYWDIGYKEGESGEPNPDKANEILHKIRMLVKPITPITADDVTDEMLEAVKKAIPMQGVVTREKVVAIYNAVIKHKNRSEAK